MSHRYCDPKELCLTEAQVDQHKQLGCKLQTLNHLVAQQLIRICRFHKDGKQRARIAEDISSISDCINLLMVGCDQIVADALRERPESVIFHIHHPHDQATEESAHMDDNATALKPNRALQLQIGTLLLLVGSVVQLLIAANFSPTSSMPVIKALKKLQKALLREHDHFQNLGATETTLSVVVDREPSSMSAAISGADNGEDSKSSRVGAGKEGSNNVCNT